MLKMIHALREETTQFLQLAMSAQSAAMSAQSALTGSGATQPKDQVVEKITLDAEGRPEAPKGYFYAREPRDWVSAQSGYKLLEASLFPPPTTASKFISDAEIEEIQKASVNSSRDAW